MSTTVLRAASPQETEAVLWEEPPERLFPDRQDRLAAALRQSPGRWARVLSGTRGRVYYQRRVVAEGRDPWTPKGAFEAVAGRLDEDDDSSWAAWARFVPEDERPAPQKPKRLRKKEAAQPAPAKAAAATTAKEKKEETGPYAAAKDGREYAVLTADAAVEAVLTEGEHPFALALDPALLARQRMRPYTAAKRLGGVKVSTVTDKERGALIVSVAHDSAS